MTYIYNLTDEEIETCSLYEISTHMPWVKISPSDLASLDSILSVRINTGDDISKLNQFANWSQRQDMPKTNAKIKSILEQCINDRNLQDSSYYMRNYIDDDLAKLIVDVWIKNEEFNHRPNIWSMLYHYNEYIEKHPQQIDVLKKLIKCYKKHTSPRLVHRIDKIFNNIPIEQLGEACDVMSKSTPAVCSLLLFRNDVDDKYIMCGLRALAKIKFKGSFSKCIELSMLEKLGPRGRLKIIKQLLRPANELMNIQKQIEYRKNGGYYIPPYYTRRVEYLKHTIKDYKFPFTREPTRWDIEKFLFPCLTKYNSEVAEILSGFDTLIQERSNTTS